MVCHASTQGFWHGFESPQQQEKCERAWGLGRLAAGLAPLGIGLKHLAKYWEISRNISKNADKFRNIGNISEKSLKHRPINYQGRISCRPSLISEISPTFQTMSRILLSEEICLTPKPLFLFLNKQWPSSLNMTLFKDE